jgi:hypothetical protein
MGSGTFDFLFIFDTNERSFHCKEGQCGQSGTEQRNQPKQKQDQGSHSSHPTQFGVCKALTYKCNVQNLVMKHLILSAWWPFESIQFLKVFLFSSTLLTFKIKLHPCACSTTFFTFFI